MIGKKCMKDLFTLADGESYDIGRVLWAMSVVWYMGLGVAAVVINKQAFNFMEAGSGIGLVLAGGGYALKAKLSTEVVKDGN